MEPHTLYRSQLSINDLLSLEDELSTLELSRGELVAEPPTGGRHGTIVVTLCAHLYAFTIGTDCGRLFASDVGFVLARDPDTVRAPDVAFVRKSRCGDVLDSDALFEGPPDIAIEVLSPSDRRSSIKRKVQDYLSAGTPLIWLIQPRARTVTIIDLESQHVLAAGDVLTAPELLPDFSLAVEAIFR